MAVIKLKKNDADYDKSRSYKSETVILLSLAGCGNQTVRQNSDKTVNGNSPADVTSDTDINDGITAEEIKTYPTAATTEKETTAPLFETPVTNLQKNPVKTSEPVKQTAEPNPPKPQKDTDIPSKPAETDTPPTPTKPAEKPKPTETSAPVTVSKPTATGRQRLVRSACSVISAL